VAWECEMRGARRTPRPGGPSCGGPGAPTVRHRALGGDRRNSVPTARRSQRPQAVDSKVSPPGAPRSKPQTPRAGRRRFGGLADFHLGRRRRFAAVPPRCGDASGPVGLSGPRRPAPPSLRQARLAMRRWPRANTTGRRSFGWEQSSDERQDDREPWKEGADRVAASTAPPPVWSGLRRPGCDASAVSRCLLRLRVPPRGCHRRFAG
jgi:hypothetical protein